MKLAGCWAAFSVAVVAARRIFFNLPTPSPSARRLDIRIRIGWLAAWGLLGLAVVGEGADGCFIIGFYLIDDW